MILRRRRKRQYGFELVKPDIPPRMRVRIEAVRIEDVRMVDVRIEVRIEGGGVGIRDKVSVSRRFSAKFSCSRAVSYPSRVALSTWGPARVRRKRAHKPPQRPKPQPQKQRPQKQRPKLQKPQPQKPQPQRPQKQRPRR